MSQKVFISLFFIILNLSLFSADTNFFRSEKISTTVKDILKEQSYEEKLASETENDCLVSESEAYTILK